MIQYLKYIACQKCWVKHLATESRIGLDITTYFKWGKVSVPSAIGFLWDKIGFLSSTKYVTLPQTTEKAKQVTL